MGVTITTRQSQLVELTHAQVDANFVNLAAAVDANTAAIATKAPVNASSFTGGIAVTGADANNSAATFKSVNATQSLDIVAGYSMTNGTAGGARNDTIMTLRSSGVAPGSLAFASGNTEFMRLDSSGNLLVNVTSGSSHTLAKNVAESFPILQITDAAGNRSAQFNAAGVYTPNGAASASYFAKNFSSSRSISASGTINASGADYAEYMTKAADCGVLAKGQIVGVDADGKLTDQWQKSISFLIKSTDPSYVGGDAWGTDEALGVARPTVPEEGEDEAYRAALSRFEAALESARQAVDLIAYCGQVPVNVTGAKPGQYVVPTQDGDRIDAVLIDSSAITFDDYRRAVGIVQNILPDGRANVRVKVV